MKTQLFAFAIAAGSTLAIANAAGTDETIKGAMTASVVPQAQVIWDITNGAMDDDGKPLPARLKLADWAKLEQATLALQVSFERLHTAPALHVAATGQKIDGDDSTDGAATAKVQGFVDADPDGFRAMAQKFSVFAGGMTAAVRQRDLKTLLGKADEMDGVCEACHKVYWFPDQKLPS